MLETAIPARLDRLPTLAGVLMRSANRWKKSARRWDVTLSR